MNRGRLRFLLLGTVASLLLELLAVQLGMLGVILNFLVPLPIAYAIMRSGLVTGVGAALLACGGMQLLGGTQAMLAFLIQFALPALLIAGLLRRPVAWDRAVLIGTLVMVVLGTGGLLVYGSLTGTSLPGLIDQYVQGEVSSALQMAGQAELTPSQADEFRAVVEQMGAFLGETFPAWGAIVTALLLALQVVFLGRIGRGHYRIPGPALTDWKLPELLIWPLILAGFCAVFGTGLMHTLAWNALVVLLPLYFLQGLAVISHFFARKEIPSFLRGLGYLMIALLNPLPIIVTGIGVFDMWADFRKPRQKKTEG